MDNVQDAGETIGDSQTGRRPSTASQGAGKSTHRGGEAGTSNVTTELVSALGGEQNFKTLMDLIAQTTSQHQQQNLTIASPGVDASRAGTPISGRSIDVPAVPPPPPPPPKRRMKLDWNSELLSLPSDQNNDVNAKTRDKFSAWGRNRRQYLNKNIRSVSAGKKSVDYLRKICSEELQQELTKISQSDSMEKIREAQKKKEESGHVFVHHLGAGGRRLFKEDFVSTQLYKTHSFCPVYDAFPIVFPWSECRKGMVTVW
ncbi:hypothetical protein R1sor_007339 [Riccia sorocarpa]|uniref:Uncharacterized protein n=1 Tax=Riccia sorocarpa TaxID=122646 RepID=A0ABD3HQL2_9MARC